MPLKPIYLYRPVLNGAEINAWYAAQGLDGLRDPAEMHLNIIRCLDPVDWDLIGLRVEPMVLSDQGSRTYERVEGEGTLAIGVNSQPLIDRWLETLRLGCTWQHHGYHPHVAINHGSGTPVDDSRLLMFPGDIILGPEIAVDAVSKAVVDEMQEDSTEKKMLVPVMQATAAATTKSAQPYVTNSGMLIKARPVGSDNRRLVEIQASVEKIDSEGDLIMQNALLGSKDKFLATGHLDIDHLSELGDMYNIPNPQDYIVGRPLDVWAGPDKETWVLGEINAQPDGSFNPDRNKADGLWKCLTENPEVIWRSSVFGYMGGDTLDCRTDICPGSGDVSRFLVKSFDWCSLAFTRNPVNDEIKHACRVVAKGFLSEETIALAKAGKSSLDLIFESQKQAGWIQNPARPSMDSVRGSVDCPNCGGLKDAPNMPILKSHFTHCVGMEPGDAELCAHARMYHFLLGKAGYFAPQMLARATGEQGASPPMIYGPGNESLDIRKFKVGRRGVS